MLGVDSLSDFLGYTSIACWLGAQFPQVLENIRLQSVDGLALPFLVNWLLGDLSNLVGCLLTHQLPFQTYLAVYFCFVDLTLFSQYFYYASGKPSGYLPIRARATSITARRLSIERAPARYRTLSNVAAHVAVAAARAAEQEEQMRWHSTALDREEPEVGDDEVDEQALARLAESFHSEHGPSNHRKTISWSTERRAGSLGRSRASTISPAGPRLHHTLHMTSPTVNTEEVDFSNRGRSVSRPSLDENAGNWPSSQRRNSRASRKGAGMVFLGVWALFGVGTLAGSGRGLPSSSGLRLGKVFAGDDYAIPGFTRPIPPVVVKPPLAHVMPIIEVPSTPVTLLHKNTRKTEPPPPPLPDEPALPTDYIIGRISAWLCTTLYLTSRLPQIWKNFARKSVEGLSMYLFVFAFLGNFFYVASILTSPKLDLPPPVSAAFIRESIPYVTHLLHFIPFQHLMYYDRAGTSWVAVVPSCSMSRSSHNRSSTDRKHTFVVVEYHAP
ncbi:unnamed protein product [Somion occarium]|uniref:Uncharacterized protein n=1 Tax=Somion occarium TaxID=3059160 RepID=A0ABP1DBS6_9APHY